MSSTCLASSPDLKSKFNDNEYNVQLHSMIKDIDKIKNDVKNGKISQEKADEAVGSLINDPRYNQVKLKKEIVEQEYKTSLRDQKPTMIPSCKTFESVVSPVSLLSSTSYTYPTVGSMTTNKGGWGIGYNVATKHMATSSDPSQYVKIAARSEAVGSYYADGYMYSYFTAPKSGNSVVRVDFDWTGGCVYPDVCSIDFVLWKYIAGTGWVKDKSDNAVSLTGVTTTSGPNNDYGSVTTYLQGGQQYCFDLQVHTKGSSLIPFSAASSSDFGFVAIGGTPKVKWKQGKVTYY